MLGNVGTLVSFRIGHTDAEVLAREFGEFFPPPNFVDLDRYAVLGKLIQDGANLQPFRARTLAPIERRVGKRAKLIARSPAKSARAASLFFPCSSRYSSGPNAPLTAVTFLKAHAGARGCGWKSRAHPGPCGRVR